MDGAEVEDIEENTVRASAITSWGARTLHCPKAQSFSGDIIQILAKRVPADLILVSRPQVVLDAVS